MTSKRSEGTEGGDFQGGMYEAAVSQEKQDDRRSHGESPGGALSEESDSGGEQEEVSVAALNVRKHADLIRYLKVWPVKQEAGLVKTEIMIS